MKRAAGHFKRLTEINSKAPSSRNSQFNVLLKQQPKLYGKEQSYNKFLSTVLRTGQGSGRDDLKYYRLTEDFFWLQF